MGLLKPIHTQSTLVAVHEEFAKKLNGQALVDENEKRARLAREHLEKLEHALSFDNRGFGASPSRPGGSVAGRIG